MTTQTATQLRLDIMADLKVELSDCLTGIMMGGSMGFGQNFSVHDESDIDLVLVCDIDQVDALLQKPFFTDSISAEMVQLFKSSVVNLFWHTKVINGIEVNAFVYETNAYRNFCTLKSDLNIFIKSKRPADTQTQYGFDGQPIVIERNVREYEDGYLFTKPALAQGKFWGGVPRQDFFYSGEIVYEKDGFLSELGKEVWTAVIAQLVKEYGPTVDLEKYNILNSHVTYQTAPQRLPESVTSKIQDRTREEVQKALK
jgi:hypothetical protein